jgi:hypothetical protein
VLVVLVVMDMDQIDEHHLNGTLEHRLMDMVVVVDMVEHGIMHLYGVQELVKLGLLVLNNPVVVGVYPVVGSIIQV